MNNGVARYGSLAVASALFIAAWVENPESTVGAGAAAAGLIAFGTWLTLEVHFLLGERTQHTDQKEDTDE